MTQWHLKSKRKSSGGMRTSNRRRDKLLSSKGGDFAETKIGPEDRRSVKLGRGNTRKTKQRAVKFAIVTDRKAKKTSKAEILTVKENRANRLYTRRNIITKGCTIEVKLGEKKALAKVTSRPGQHGNVNAVLIEGQ